MRTPYRFLSLVLRNTVLTILIVPGWVWAETSPLLHISTLQVAPGQVVVDFGDSGTGATNYTLEFSPTPGDGSSWTAVADAILSDLGGGSHRAVLPNPQTESGFYRVVGLGGELGAVTVGFNSTVFQVTEGGMVSPIITFSAPYYGVVRYTIDGTAMTGDYATLSGVITVSGSTASIPISITDNELIGQFKHLTLTLETGPALLLGAGSSTTINILENDADWQGNFITDNAKLGFVLRIKEVDGVRTASLRSEGFGFFPANETPTSLSFTDDFFAATTAPIPVVPNATLLNLPLSLTLSLSGQNGLTNQSVSPTQIQGLATLTTVVTGKPQLTTTNSGSFILLKPPVAPSTNQVPLQIAF